MLDLARELCHWALHFAPVLALLVLLLRGRYPGEQALARLRRAPARRLVPQRAPVRVRARVALLPRTLMGRWELAVRPPPVAA